MHRTPFLPLAIVLPVLPLAAQDQGSAGGARASSDLTELSLEELMNVEVEVTSAARHAVPLSKTPAAVFVLTEDDIRRSGATALPEVLRLVPGVEVARLDASRWAVTIRGFNDQFANKLLVLVDGRSVYTPLFSGAVWDMLDIPLQDVERIEVIRGPGGALWGANAVNGIVNIITKSAERTQGTYVSALTGSEEDGGYVRHGGTLASGHWRAWAHFADREPTLDAAGNDGEDSWRELRGGFRADLAPSERDTWTIAGDVQRGLIDDHYLTSQPTAPFVFSQKERTDAWAASVQSRWTRTLGPASEFELRTSLEYTSRELAIYSEKRTTADVDFQHRFALSSSQDFLWGLNARLSNSRTEDTFLVSWRDNDRTDALLGAFAQDEIELVPDRWSLIAGTKVEHAETTGFAVQPNLRLLFTPSETQTWWASASRAVRTPSQADQDVSVLQAAIPGVPNQLIFAQGDRDVDPETLDALELGWRARPADSVSIDVAAYYNHYRDLVAYEPGTPTFVGGDLVIPFVATNRPSADAYGVELAVDWAPRPDTRVSAAWTHQELQVDANGSTAPGTRDAENTAPESRYRLRLQRDFGSAFEGDCTLFYVDRIPLGDVDHYWRLDARLEYRPDAGRSIALGVQNLLHDGAIEYANGFLNPSNEMQTAVYLQASWSF